MKTTTTDTMFAVCKACNLDSHSIRRITLDWSPGQVATIYVQHDVDSTWVEKLAESLGTVIIKKVPIWIRAQHFLIRVKRRLHLAINKAQTEYRSETWAQK